MKIRKKIPPEKPSKILEGPSEEGVDGEPLIPGSPEQARSRARAVDGWLATGRLMREREKVSYPLCLKEWVVSRVHSGEGRGERPWKEKETLGSGGSPGRGEGSSP